MDNIPFLFDDALEMELMWYCISRNDMPANLDSVRGSLERAANELDMVINDINLDRALDDSIPDHDSIDLVVEELCAINKRLAIISMACGFKVFTGEDGVILR